MATRFASEIARLFRLWPMAAALVASSAAGADIRPPFRAGLSPVAPLVAQMDLAGARIRQGAATLFAAAETPPVVDWLAGVPSRVLRAKAVDDGALDLAWELLSGDQRAIALALDGWATDAKTAERRRLRAAIADVYAARSYRPLWSDGDGWRDAAGAAAETLRGAIDDGLDLRAYPIPATDRGAASVADDLALSEAVVVYAQQASGGRVDPARISRLIGARPNLPAAAAALASVSAAGPRAGETLQAFNPPHYGYQALRAKLAELRGQRALDGISPDRPVTEARAESTRNDGPPAGVKAARRRAGSLARGSTSRLEAEIIANMERWRWLPRDLGENRIEVNIPDFELAVVRDGQVAHRTRVIVGKEETPTPIFSDAMQYIIVNPYWHVPPSIIKKEWGGDVSRAAQRGWKVSYRNGQVSVAQPPGESNALGRIKFIFPNDFAVYMHDTPSRNLFSAAHRAFSHGCMRVEAPFALAEAVLGPGSGWSEARVKRLIGGAERYINLAKPLPVHVEYFTAYVDEYGQLQTRGDLYGYSARVRNALGLGG